MMMIITKDRIAECNELKLEDGRIMAYVRGVDDQFAALACVDKDVAKGVFEDIAAAIRDGETVFDMTDFDLNIYKTCRIDDAPIKKVGTLEALRIVRNREPLGRFYFVKMTEDGERYLAIDNTDGQAYCEAFDDLQTCQRWLKGEFDW